MNALEAAQCAKIAYLDEGRGAAAAFRLGYSFQFISNNFISCWIGTKNGKTVVGFRGSVFFKSSEQNYELNLKTDFVPWIGQGLVHEGYHQAFWYIFYELMKIIRSRRDIIFTGHSMGGAIALLAGSIMQVGHVFCFASPRVGNKAFKDSFNIETGVTRFENRGDLLTKYPFSGVVKSKQNKEKDRYAHVGKRILLPTFGHSIGSYLQGLNTKSSNFNSPS